MDRLLKWMFFGGWALSTLLLYMGEIGSGSLSWGLLAFSLFVGFAAALFLTMLGYGLSRKIAAIYFRKELASERERLLSKYPAARGRTTLQTSPA